MSPLSKVFVIVNGASGAKNAKEIYDKEVLPFIKESCPNIQIQEFQTEHPDHATTIIQDLIKNNTEGDNELNLILLGGDGTTHEVVNGLIKRDGDNVKAKSARIAIVPTGTANALYASLYAKEFGSDFQNDKLRSLKAMLTSNTDSQTYPLALSLVQTTTSEKSQNFVAHLITSHALHASILADSESLRDQYPGVERFKMAFGQNMAKWISSSIELKPFRNGKVQIYDPAQERFIDHADTKIDDAILYFACVTTDRLEPNFVPAPFSGPVNDQTHLSRPKDAVDIILYRPQRSPKFSSRSDIDKQFWIEDQSESIRKNIGERDLIHISGLMYQEGKHVDLTYKEDDGFEEKGNGTPVIEYYRCSGYSWIPNEQSARRTCIDGTVIESDHTELRVLSKEEGAGNIVICR